MESVGIWIWRSSGNRWKRTRYAGSCQKLCIRNINDGRDEMSETHGVLDRMEGVDGI
jgi:hypothetical protein